MRFSISQSPRPGQSFVRSEVSSAGGKTRVSAQHFYDLKPHASHAVLAWADEVSGAKMNSAEAGDQLREGPAYLGYIQASSQRAGLGTGRIPGIQCLREYSKFWPRHLSSSKIEGSFLDLRKFHSSRWGEALPVIR